MVEYTGILFIHLKDAKNLVVADVVSSDPYPFAKLYLATALILLQICYLWSRTTESKEQGHPQHFKSSLERKTTIVHQWILRHSSHFNVSILLCLITGFESIGTTRILEIQTISWENAILSCRSWPKWRKAKKWKWTYLWRKSRKVLFRSHYLVSCPFLILVSSLTWRRYRNYSLNFRMYI